MPSHDFTSLQNAYLKVVNSNDLLSSNHQQPTSLKDVTTLTEAYQQIIEESKHFNKKFIRRYNRVTAELLKAEIGSKEYIKLKNERDDLVNILKDHGMSPADLDKMSASTKKQDTEESVDDVTEKTEPPVKTSVCTTCGSDHDCTSCPEIGAH